MRYSLHLATAADDKRGAYAYCITNYKGEQARGVFVTAGRRRFDENYTAHVALQRALRHAARLGGIIQLTVVLDHSLIDAIGYELGGLEPPTYATLSRTTTRLTKRFTSCDLAAMSNEDDLQPGEATAADEALDALEHYRTLKGRWQLCRDAIVNPRKLIK